MYCIVLYLHLRAIRNQKIPHCATRPATAERKLCALGLFPVLLPGLRSPVLSLPLQGTQFPDDLGPNFAITFSCLLSTLLYRTRPRFSHSGRLKTFIAAGFYLCSLAAISPPRRYTAGRLLPWTERRRYNRCASDTSRRKPLRSGSGAECHSHTSIVRVIAASSSHRKTVIVTSEEVYCHRVYFISS